MAFSYYKTATTDSSQCGTADTTDFILLINVTDADLKSVSNGGFVQSNSGYDIRLFSDIGLTGAFTFQLTQYDPTIGQLVMFVKIPTLNHSANQTFYLGFGDASIVTDGSSTSTWNSHVKAVWHMDPASSTQPDSVASPHDLTLHDNFGQAGGQIYKGQLFNPGGYGENSSTADLLGGSTDYGISLWFAYNGGGIRPGDWAFAGQWEGGNGWMLYSVPDDTPPAKIRIYANANFVEWTDPIATGAYHYVVAGKSGSNGLLYIDGSLVSSQSLGSSALTPATTPIDVGQYSNHGGSETTDFFDEVRVWDTMPSASQITAEYNNQKTSSTFLTWGSKTPVTTKFILIPGR